MNILYMYAMTWNEIFKNKNILLIIGSIIVFAILVWLYIKRTKNIANNREKYDPAVKNTNSIVLYYASWCDWSKKFIPVWDKFAEQINSTMKDKITASKIDCAVNGEQCSKMNDVNGFPTVLLHLANGTIVPYNGNRTQKDLFEFVTSNI